MSQQPQFKSSPAQLVRKTFAEPEPWLVARRAELAGESSEPFSARSIGGTVSCHPR